MFKGIDISHHQGNPDFGCVKAAGIQYVLVKATEGINYVDPCFHTNSKAAIAAGLPVGAYHFLRDGSIADQVKDFLAAIKPYKITWPAAVDVEDSPKSTELSSLGSDKLTDRVLEFCAQVKAAGYQPMVYSNRNWFYLTKLLDIARIRAAGIPVWMAWYSNAVPENTDRSSLCDLWQYASDGRVDGISGKVDMNVAYRDFGVPDFTCDTTMDLERKPGGWYQFKVTSEKAPKVNVGSDDVAVILPRYQSGNEYFYYMIGYGAPGSATGVYVNDILQFRFKLQ